MINEQFRFFIVILLPFFCFAALENRPICLPYISGDAFRFYCDYALDEQDSFDPKKVLPNSTIFVQTDHLKGFIDRFHEHIPGKYILVTHNSDAVVPGSLKKFLDDPKLIAWFGENWDGTNHPKMHPIPMGFAIDTFPWGNGKLIEKILALMPKKEHLSHMGFTLSSCFRERGELFLHFSIAPYVFFTGRKPIEEYLYDVAISKFEFAPRGIAPDTHRVWESLYLGTIPILKRSPLDSLYDDLPVLIVKDWKEIDEALLNEKYEEIRRKSYKKEKLFMDYWIRLIDSCKQNDNSKGI